MFSIIPIKGIYGQVQIKHCIPNGGHTLKEKYVYRITIPKQIKILHTKMHSFKDLFK